MIDFKNTPKTESTRNFNQETIHTHIYQQIHVGIKHIKYKLDLGFCNCKLGK